MTNTLELETFEEQVSFGSEELILVDEQDNPVGTQAKIDCHLGEGVLHRAFSVFLFNSKGELLLQQRSAQKMLWPLFWTNTCCSHPRSGEDMQIATKRRLYEELRLSAELTFLYKFEYQATFGDVGSEHELCHVYIGKADTEPTYNQNEIQACRYISPDALDAEMAAEPEAFTPWFKLEWARIKEGFLDKVNAL